MTLEISNDYGKIDISNEVIASVVGGKAVESYGIVGMASRQQVRDGIAEILGHDNYAKGIKVREENGTIDIDVQNEITLLSQGEHQVNQDSTYPYISFIPLNDEVIISLEGFKYNLSHEHLESGSTLTISNEVTTNVAKVNVEKGTVLQMRSTD